MLRIIVYSPAFYPLIGGLEEVARLCCQEFVRAGHKVQVLTQTPLGDRPEQSFPVLRQPSFAEALAATQKSDVFVEFNISLKGLVFPMLAGKPIVVSHQSWFSNIRQPPTTRARLKRHASRFVTNIACSHAINQHLGGTATVIPNAYDEHTFRIFPDVPREQDLLFVGRLVSDKGCSLLLQALSLLQAEGLFPSLTIIGSGPEQDPLARQSAELGLATQVSFAGSLRGETLARAMNRHRIMVVPSTWAEPFGIVALEGIACGCEVIGSDAGGLVDAIGPCGTTFSSGDPVALKASLHSLLSSPPKPNLIRETHLAAHTSKSVGKAYLEVLQQVNSQRIPALPLEPSEHS